MLPRLGRVTPIADDDTVQNLSDQTNIDVPEIPTSTENENVHRRSSSLYHQQRVSRTSMGLSSPGTLSFYNINYTVGGTRINSKCKNFYPHCMKPKEGKQILYDVSGVFTSGMNAIMGKNLLFHQIEYQSIFIRTNRMW